jgi:fluoride ion exporter CrcB/FEX
MLSNIWVSITGAITGHDRFYVSRLVPQRCAKPFDPDTFVANINGLFIRGCWQGRAGSKKLLLVSPSIRQLSLTGLLGSSVTSVRVIHCRAEM